MNLTVAGIGTDVGKTVCSAMFCEAFGLDYWKPVQAGNLDCTDSDVVKKLSPATKIWPEAYRLAEPMSPHAAASRDSVRVELKRLSAPSADGLVVELAGGLMVPLNDTKTTIDLARQLGFPVVLAANYYLGSINHTLLSISLLKRSGLSIVGVVFVGEANNDSREVILTMSGIELLADVSETSSVTPEFVRNYAERLRKHPGLASL